MTTPCSLLKKIELFWWEELYSKSVSKNKERCSKLEQLKYTGGEGLSVGDLAGMCVERLLLVTWMMPLVGNSKSWLHRQKPEDNGFKACL